MQISVFVSWSPRGQRRGSAATCLLGLRVRIPPGTWMSLFYECCVSSGWGLCDGLITQAEESYRVWSRNVENGEVLGPSELSIREKGYGILFITKSVLQFLNLKLGVIFSLCWHVVFYGAVSSSSSYMALQLFIEFWPSQPTLSIFFYLGQGSSSLVLLSSVYLF